VRLADSESRRLDALLAYDILDSEAEQAFDDLVTVVARTFEVPMAAVSLIDRGRQWFKARIGLEPPETPRHFAFCDHVVRSKGLLVVPDAHTDARFASNPLVTGAPGIRFYAGAPLISPEGHALGALCVLDQEPRVPSPEHLDTLQIMARQVMAQLQLRRMREPELALRAEQLLNHQIVTMSPIGIAIYDREGHCITTNEAMAGHVGTTELQLRGQNFHHLASWKESGLYELATRAADTGVRTSGVVHGTSSAGKAFSLSADLVVLAASSIGHLMLMTQDLRAIKHAELARREIQDQFQMLFTHSIDGILLGRPDGTLTAANPAACAMLGLPEAEVLARGRQCILDPSDPRLAAMSGARLQTGHTRGELTVIRGDGTHFEADFSSVLYPDNEGQLRSSSIMRDCSERRRMAAELERSLELLKRLAQRVPGVLYQYRLYPDGHSCFPFASEEIQTIYELSPEEVRSDASAVFQRLHPDDAEATEASIRISAATLEPWRHEYRVVLPRQGVRWRMGNAKPERLEDGSVLWHGFITDITDRKYGEEQTHWLAYFDSLTALPNRRLLLDRTSQALALSRRTGQHGCLLFIDLDHFKRINDARGHAVGDALLQQVAQRLTRVLRSDDTVARLGGDEFVILVCNLGSDAETAARAARAISEKIRAAIDRPYSIEGKCYASAGTIGITVFPKNEETVDDLLREADTAMYRAKEAGRNRVAFFESTMQAEVEEHLALENDLKDAITRNQLEVHVQGQFDPAGRLEGAELLLRWKHPVRGTIPPAQFIPIAESTGLILQIGEWVLEQACLALTRLSAAGRTESLSINVSPRQFRDEHFVTRVREILVSSGAPACQLIFEVTEGLAIEELGPTAERMAELAGLGIRFSIDDFGTGYSSLAYLKNLPIYEIKIDRSFVRDLPADHDDLAIVKAILAVAHQLGLRVVAEGVETAEQAEFLTANGCRCLQGFLYARPTPLQPWIDAQISKAAANTK
jgi:diguanylate cyclase (GGDEF)-like protein/PAS domain S-box-containing protein